MNGTRANGTGLTDVGLLLLRLGVGAGLMTHGYPKLFGGPGKAPPAALTKLVGSNFPASVERGGIEEFSGGLERMGIPLPQQAALALGFKTRLVAPVIFFNMLVAIRKAHWKAGFHGQGGYEMAFLFALAAATLAFTGPGAYSLDGHGRGHTERHIIGARDVEMSEAARQETSQSSSGFGTHARGGVCAGA
ncbi:MAG: DoxX family protein [Thermomicrobiales bacterium]